jgi:hypothetical protein
MEFKDWDIVFIRNEDGISIFNKIFYFLIRFFLKSKYNHCVIIRDFNGKLYVCESIVSGFVVSKTLDRFIDEQKRFKRDLLIKRFKVTVGSRRRFVEIIGAKYNANYIYYLLGINHKKMTFNCFQAIGYIINDNDWWKVKPNYLLKIFD